jgi:hypothetical protein
LCYTVSVLGLFQKRDKLLVLVQRGVYFQKLAEIGRQRDFGDCSIGHSLVRGKRYVEKDIAGVSVNT